MGATGFEPVKAEPADLQSAPFGHFGTLPGRRDCVEAGERVCQNGDVKSTT